MGSTSRAILDGCECATLVVRATAFISAPHDAPPFRLHSYGAPEQLPHAAHRARSIAFAVDGSPLGAVTAAWALRKVLTQNDRITLIHSTYGLGAAASLSAAAQVLKVEQLLAKELRIPSPAAEPTRLASAGGAAGRSIRRRSPSWQSARRPP